MKFRPGPKASSTWSRRARARHIDHARTDAGSGFTLIEVTIAAIMLMIVLIPMGYLMDTIVGQAATQSETTAAHQVAESWVEQLANQPATNIGLGPQTQLTSTVGGINYGVTTELNWADTSGTSLCITGSQPQVLVARVVVTWNNGTSKVSDSTQFDPINQVIDPTQGFLALPIYGNGAADQFSRSYSQRVSAIPVLLTSSALAAPGYETVYPTTDGCVFVELPAGTYSVSLSTPSGYSTPFAGYPLQSTATASEIINAQQTTVDLNGLYFDEGDTVTNNTAPAVTTVEDGVTCGPGATACATGGESTGGATLFTGSGTNWQQVTVTGSPGAVRFDAEACTTATNCFAVGEGTTGPDIATYNPVADTASLVQTNLTGAVGSAFSGANVQSLTNVVCNAAACVVSGVDNNGEPVYMTYTVATSTWSPVTVLPQAQSITSIACSTLTCVAIGTTTAGTNASFIYTIASSTWAAPTQFDPTKVNSATGIACTSSTCLVVGAGLLGHPPVYLTYADGGAWSTASPITGLASGDSVGQMTCVASTCFALGTHAGNPVSLSFATGAWTTLAAFPSGIATVSSLTCPDAAHCYATANASTSGTVIEYASSAWSIVLPNAVAAPTYMSGLSCTSSTTCYIAGTAASGAPEIITDAAGTWTPDLFSASLHSAAGTLANIDVFPASQTPTVQLLPSSPKVFYPSETGYLFWADNYPDAQAAANMGVTSCSNSANNGWLTPVAMTPGGTVTVGPGLGLLDVQIVSPTNRAPVPGVVVTATRNSCTGDAAQTVTTNTDGIAVLAVPPGTYAVTTPLGGTGTVTASQLGTLTPSSVKN